MHKEVASIKISVSIITDAIIDDLNTLKKAQREIRTLVEEGSSDERCRQYLATVNQEVKQFSQVATEVTAKCTELRAILAVDESWTTYKIRQYQTDMRHRLTDMQSHETRMQKLHRQIENHIATTRRLHVEWQEAEAAQALAEQARKRAEAQRQQEEVARRKKQARTVATGVCGLQLDVWKQQKKEAVANEEYREADRLKNCIRDLESTYDDHVERVSSKSDTMAILGELEALETAKLEAAASEDYRSAQEHKKRLLATKMSLF